jgi:hypothetical protein
MEMVRHHVSEIRARYRHAVIAIFCEGQGGWLVPDRVMKMLRRSASSLEPLYGYSMDGERYGVTATHDDKHAYALVCHDIMRDKEVEIAQELLPRYESKPTAAVLTEFFGQLARFRRERRRTGDGAFESIKVSYTAKSGGINDNDDLLLAWLIAVTWGRQHRNNETFRRYVTDRGLNV